MSSVDVHTHCGYQLMLPEAVAVVYAPCDNKKRYVCTRFSFFDECGPHFHFGITSVAVGALGVTPPPPPPLRQQEAWGSGGIIVETLRIAAAMSLRRQSIASIGGQAPPLHTRRD